MTGHGCMVAVVMVVSADDSGCGCRVGAGGARVSAEDGLVGNKSPAISNYCNGHRWEMCENIVMCPENSAFAHALLVVCR